MIEAMSLSLAIHDAAAPESGRDRALAAMDEEEFRAFYERTARPLWAYLSRITGSTHEADDVLQEAYYRFYRRAAEARYESESHRRNSLFRIATNIVRDAARRARHHEDVPIETDLPSGSPIPARQAEIRTDLARAMEQLEPAQREMLWLAYAQGASHEEIAAIVGGRAISIRTQLLRARRKLAAILTGEVKR
jgi:RNA polymerase sigma-70 factor (ECF subfamily)